MRKKRMLIGLALVLSGMLCLGAREIVEEIVAIVNDDIITLSQYKAQHNALYQMLRSQLEGEEFEKQYGKLKSEILNSMITELLLLQSAKEKDLNVSEQVRMWIENIKKENNIESDEDLKRELRRQGIDFEQWMKQAEENILKQTVIYTEVDRTIVIDESEMVNYYKLHPEEFTNPEEYRVRAIYLSFEERSAEEAEMKKKEISGKIAAGEDFAVLASQHSEGPEKESQGDLGSFKRGELEKNLEQAVGKLKVGEMTPWLKTKNGWYLLRLEEKKESHLRTFDEVKKAIEEKLFREKHEMKLAEFLKKLKEKSYIKILKPNPLDL